MIENWIGDRKCEPICMKPLLSAAMDEAFHIAVVDSIPDLTDKRRIEIFRDIECMTAKEWGSINPSTLKHCIFIRMFGNGNSTVRGVSSGNASNREKFESCISNTEANKADDIIYVMNKNGLNGKKFISPDNTVG